MQVNDPVGDLIARINNAQMRKKPKVSTPGSRLRVSVLEVLKNEGFINGVSSEEDGKQGLLTLELRYDNNNDNAIQGIRRVSRPGQRTYARTDDGSLLADAESSELVGRRVALRTDDGVNIASW